MSMARLTGMDGDRFFLVGVSRWWRVAVDVSRRRWVAMVVSRRRRVAVVVSRRRRVAVVVSRRRWVAVVIAAGWRVAVMVSGLRIVAWRRACLGRWRRWMIGGWRRIVMMVRSTVWTIAAAIDVWFSKIDVCNFVTAESQQYA